MEWFVINATIENVEAMKWKTLFQHPRRSGGRLLYSKPAPLPVALPRLRRCRGLRAEETALHPVLLHGMFHTVVPLLSSFQRINAFAPFQEPHKSFASPVKSETLRLVEDKAIKSQSLCDDLRT
jgi:hypothetical protein